MPVTADKLSQQKCVPCEGGVPTLSADEVREHLAALPDWHLSADGRHVRRVWKRRDFLDAMAFFGRIAELAEAEGHHPDLHLTDYKKATVEITTHAAGGLTANDFVLAAKIDRLPA